MNRRIAVLASGWSSYFLKDFVKGMMKAVEDKHIDIYLFNTYNYDEYSGFPNYTGLFAFKIRRRSRSRIRTLLIKSERITIPSKSSYLIIL